MLVLLCHLQQPQIILLKEGTDTSQGKAQLVSNINACVAVVDAVRTTLGPRGMDKLICNERVRQQARNGLFFASLPPCTSMLPCITFLDSHCNPDPCTTCWCLSSLVVMLQGVTISNDGATIMKLLDIVHPAAKTLVDISLSQDAEVGRVGRGHTKPVLSSSHLAVWLVLA